MLRGAATRPRPPGRLLGGRSPAAAPAERCYGTRPSPRGEQGEAASGWPCAGGGGARSPRAAGVLLRPAVTAPAPLLPARHACPRPPLAEHGAGEGRGEPPCHSLSQPPPHRRSPVSDGHGAAPLLSAPGGLRAPRTSPQVSDEASGGESARALPLAPELQPARSRHLSSGVQGLRPARSCRRCLGARGDAPLPSAVRGRGSGTGGWFGGFFPARNGLSASRTERAGVPAAAALRAAATHPLLSELGPKYFSAAVACPAGRDPGSALPRRGLPRAEPPMPLPSRRVAPLPFFSRELGFA